MKNSKKLFLFLLVGMFMLSFGSAAITTTLNSPADNYILLTNPQMFNGSSVGTG